MIKKGKYHSFLIMPSTPGKKIIKFTLPSYVWSLFSIISAVILVWAAAGAWIVFRHNAVAEKCQVLEQENRSAKTQLEDRNKEVEYLNRELNRIREKAGFIEKFLGLESQGAAEGRIGQGGEEVGSNFEAIEPPAPAVQTASMGPREIGKLAYDLNHIIEALETKQKELEHTPSISPIDSKDAWISSSYGLRISPFTGKKQFHLGVDIAACKGTPILAPASGVVSYVGKQRLMGLTVKIRHNRTFTTMYGHLLKAKVKKGRSVKRGEVIGYMGTSGRSTGYHVHYSVAKNGKHVNPFYLMMDWDKKHTALAAAEEID